MNAIDLLRIDHQRLFNLVERFQDKGTSSATLAERLNQLTLALRLHRRMEEEVFYPELKEFDEVRSLVMQSYHDNRIIEKLLERLSDLLKKPSGQDSASLAARLVLAVEEHISQDDDNLLPQAEGLLGPTRLQELFYDMDEIRTHQSDMDIMIYPASRLGPEP